ncbi:MAG: N,N-dimethylformamidase beta subunit family domain-containing protein, partial [bacterium]
GCYVLVGFVSDQNYLAVSGAQVEIRGVETAPLVLRSSAAGALYADVPEGHYDVAVAKRGYGSKRSRNVRLGGDVPRQFRLLSDQPLGYVWPGWCRAGDPVEFRLHSVEPCKLGLWRYGAERELVRNVGWYDDHGPRAIMQTLPDGHFVETGVKWFAGNMTVHSQVILAPARTGLYYFHMKGESGAFFSFPLVVAPASPSAGIAVLANTNTWNAYNSFGGRSNYCQAVRMGDEPVVNSRQDLPRYRLPEYGEWQPGVNAPLSFDRPNPANAVPESDRLTDPIEGRMACALAPAEWRTLGWMERNGFPHDVYSDYQLHSGELPLDRYKVLMLNVHPEYWSIDAYKRVKDWVRNRGGRLVYFGGNGMNGPVEYPDASTMRCINAMPPEKESRFHAAIESEATLLGVVFSNPGAMTVAPYRAFESDHWIFEGTGLRDGQEFGRKTLHERYGDGASGHETDKRSPS